MRNNKGITLVEVLLALVISVILISLAFSLQIFGSRTFQTGVSQAYLQNLVRISTGFIVSEVRLQDNLLVGTANIEYGENSVIDSAYLDNRFLSEDEGVSINLSDVELAKNLLTFTVTASGGNNQSYELTTNVLLLNHVFGGLSDFARFLIDENVFLFSSNLEYRGDTISGLGATVIINGSIFSSDFNLGNEIFASNIFVNGDMIFTSGSSSWGSQISPGETHINGDLELLSGKRDMYGDIYVNGDFILKDAIIHGNVFVDGNLELDWTPTINGNIYYTGDITYPANNYDDELIAKCKKRDTVPSVKVLNQEIPGLKPDEWFESHSKYRTDNPMLENNMWIFSDNFTSSRNAENVVIVSKSDISFTGWRKVSGVFYAPYGKVTFNQGEFKGLIIARDGFHYTGGGGSVTFKNIEEFINDSNDFPF